MSNCSFLLNPQQLSPRSLTPNRTTRPTSCCAASSRAGGSAGGQSRATVPLLTDLKLVFSASTGKKIDASRSFKKKRKKKGQLLPASGQSEQNVSSVLTSTPSAVLVHVNTLIFVLVFFFFCCCCCCIFRCKFTLYYFSFSVSLCQSECRLKSKPHNGDRKKKKKRRVVTSEILHRHCQLHMITGGRKNTQRSSCHVKKKKTRCKKSVSPRGCFCHRTFQLDTRWCGMSFAITALLVILARCHSS